MSNLGQSSIFRVFVAQEGSAGGYSSTLRCCSGLCLTGLHACSLPEGQVREFFLVLKQHVKVLASKEFSVCAICFVIICVIPRAQGERDEHLSCFAFVHVAHPGAFTPGLPTELGCSKLL